MGPVSGDGCAYDGVRKKAQKMARSKLSWPSGATYEGEIMGGYLNGYGIYTGSDGSIFKGQWAMNQMHGIGRKLYANGDVYEGQWKQGIQDGEGRYVWINGDEYYGQWKNGTMCGRGLMRWNNGDKYDGQWLDGNLHGQGIYRWAVHGSLYVGSWSKGLKDGKGVFYPNRRISFEDSSSPSWDQQSQNDDTSEDLNSCRKFRRESSIASDYEYRFAASSNHGSFDATSWKSFTERCSRRGNSFDTEICSSTEDSVDSFGMTEFDEFEEGSYEGSDEACYPVFEREYSQGVLIRESFKENMPPKGHRKSKRSSKEGKKQGEVVFKGHRNYDLMINLQLGIRYTVGRITPEPKREIVSADFGPKAKIRMKFPPEGSASTPPHSSIEFKWKDYCPLVFRNLRELFEIDAADYMLSICGNDALREFSSPGKSGSLFYMSHDDRFMIKTMRKAEVKVLLRMLPNYYNHVRTYQNTLVTKFFGVHAIKPTGGQKVRFVVMHNMFCSTMRIHRRYDLKGSSQGRMTDKVDIQETTTLKDLDLDFVFLLEPSWRRALIKQIEHDCKLLAKEKIMDYSLLLGVHLQAPHIPATFSPARLSDNRSHKPELLSGGGAYSRRMLGQYDSDKYLPDDTGSNDTLQPDSPTRLCIRLGVNMPARARPKRPRSDRDFRPDAEVLTEEYDVVLYFGIIDILQEYDMSKKLEHAYKSLQFDATSISAVDPKQYSKRFRDFISKIFPAET